MSTDKGQDNAGVVGRPPITYVLSMLAGHLLDGPFPLAMPGDDGRVMAGRIISALSFGLFLASAPLFKKYGTSIKPYKPTSAIISTGTYRLSRNPIYLSMSLLHFGVALWNGSYWMLVTLAFTVWFMTKYVIEREEAYLERSFGEEYLSYKRSVRRWF